MVVKNARSALVVLLVGLLTLYAPLTHAYHTQVCMSKEQYVDRIQALNPGMTITNLTPEDLIIFEHNYNAKPPVTSFNITDVVVGITRGAPMILIAIVVDECVKAQEGFSVEMFRKMITRADSI
jgi:hypothetical protein